MGGSDSKRKDNTKLAPTRLFELLETGAKLPHGTRDIVVNSYLIVHIWRRSGKTLHTGGLYEAFYGRPVKAVFSVLRWAEKNAPGDPEEQMRAVENWGRKQPQVRNGNEGKGAA